VSVVASSILWRKTDLISSPRATSGKLAGSSPNFESLFFEPFYQLMRQQLLAHEMEQAREKAADVVSVLHLSPASNRDFRRVTSPELEPLGDTPSTIWRRLVRPSDRFTGISTEELLGRLSNQDIPAMADWLDYLHARFPWVQLSRTATSNLGPKIREERRPDYSR
jgi:hypothetical protein